MRINKNHGKFHEIINDQKMQLIFKTISSNLENVQNFLKNSFFSNSDLESIVDADAST